jgi:hypothetical protein
MRIMKLCALSCGMRLSPVGEWVGAEQAVNSTSIFLGVAELYRLTFIQRWGSGSAGSACIWASWIRIRLRILHFSHKCVERTEIMPGKKLNTKF